MIAYSYIRFSRPEQAKGDSLRRQTEKATEWCQRNKVKLDTSTTFHDLGKSAFTGKHRENPDRNALAAFLSMVERNRVPKGSYLIVESLDRLTREHALPALTLISDLLTAGIRIVQLAPVEIVYDNDKLDTLQLMMAVLELSRGNSESEVKSQRVGAAWARKKATDKPHGRAIPAWVELVDGKYGEKKGAADTVRRIYQWSAKGLGIMTIVKRLRAEEVPPIGRGTKKHGPQWNQGYVAKILRDRTVIGEYQPMKGGPRTKHGKRTRDGDAKPGYYPRVVSDELFYAVQKAKEARDRLDGRPGRGEPHVLSGLLYCALDQCKMHVTVSHGRKYMISARARNGETRARAFPLPEFTEALLDELKEIPASELFDDPGAGRVAELETKIANKERLRADARRRYEDPEAKPEDVREWGDRLSEYDRDIRSLKTEQAEARQEVANPLSATWAEAVATADPLSDCPIRGVGA